MPAGQLDGIVRLADGSLLVSSWQTNTVYHVDQQNQVHAILPNMTSPADIGYDTRRARVSRIRVVWASAGKIPT